MCVYFITECYCSLSYCCLLFRFYKQEYCGCLYSLRDTNLWRKQQGQGPVVTGGGGVFSDPVADAAEESQEVVSGFFASADNHFDDKRREMYAARKKNTVSEPTQDTSLHIDASAAKNIFNVTTTPTDVSNRNSMTVFDVNNW